MQVIAQEFSMKWDPQDLEEQLQHASPPTQVRFQSSETINDISVRVYNIPWGLNHQLMLLVEMVL